MGGASWILNPKLSAIEVDKYGRILNSAAKDIKAILRNTRSSTLGDQLSSINLAASSRPFIDAPVQSVLLVLVLCFSNRIIRR